MQYVHAKIRRFKKRFKEVKKAAQQSLKQSVSVETITATLRSLSADNTYEHKLFTDSHLSILEQAHNQSALIGQLDFNTDYLSYHLLDYLVSEFGLEEVKVQMEAYKGDLERFRERTPVAMFCQTQQWRRIQLSPEFQEVCAEFERPDNDNDMSLEAVEQFRQKYRAHYCLRDSAITLSGICLGSSTIRVTWFVPQCLTEKLRTELPRVIFKQYRVIKVTIAGSCVYRFHKQQVRWRDYNVSVPSKLFIVTG